MPSVGGVLETSLYVDELDRAERFYRDVLGLSTMVGDDRFRALSVAGRQVLLLFKKGASLRATTIPGGVIPPHDGAGHLHLAFAVDAAELPRWEEALAAHGVAVEGRVRWPRGGDSVYFRDPDGHLVEFVTPGCWAIY
jgi:catechol 2,3-dioxygenase-like lactoylglutathione lyase family enzyme